MQALTTSFQPNSYDLHRSIEGIIKLFRGKVFEPKFTPFFGVISGPSIGIDLGFSKRFIELISKLFSI
jgi:hypothetical protein